MRLREQVMSIDDIVVSSEQTAIRTPGVHVSGIINYLAVALGRRDNDFSLDDLKHFGLLGRIFERVLAESLYKPPRYQRVGEIELDGIIGSPDVWDADTNTVGEIKLTWKSCGRDIIDFHEYWWQIKSYCRMLQTPRAFLVVLFVCGDWKPPVPVLKRWDVEFTKSELEQNWAMMKGNAQAAGVHT